MWKIILISLFLLLFIVTPCFAITQSELDKINQEMEKLTAKNSNNVDYSQQLSQYETSLMFLELIDWGQTRTIATEKEPICQAYFDDSQQHYHWVKVDEKYKYHEINPLLGEHPSLEKVNYYFASCILADLAINKYANKNFAKTWDILGILCESYFVSRNFRLGINVKL